MSELVQITAEERDRLVADALERGRTEGRTAAEAVAVEQITAARTEGAAAERGRIQAVEAQSMRGHEPLIATLKFDGKTTGPEAAVQVLAAEKAKGRKKLGEIRDGSPEPAPFVEAPAEEKTEAKEPDVREVAAKAKKYQAEQKRAGIDLSVQDAVAHVRKEMGAPAKK